MLLDHRGQPVKSSAFKKVPPPKTGETWAAWGESQSPFGNILGAAGNVQFNLDNLVVNDFRQMRSHYQVNASLAVLSFMQHQSDWHIECESQKIADECDYQLRRVWTPLNRAMSHANWAGYAPCVLDWQNDSVRGKVVLDKVKDIVPEYAEVNWKEIDAWRPGGGSNQHQTAKVKIYDGIKQVGAPWPTPADNTFWYPLLMEHGDHKGLKLLKAAFTSWYFSMLIHLFANRYFERFGEPIVKARAPFEDDVKLPDGTRLDGVQYMLRVVKDLRSRSVVTLPNDATPVGDTNRITYDYDLEYLESQMRGADWERYLTRLDEEISIGLFTPILLLRTADVGSYNLGVGHMQMYLWMLNAMNSDRALYIDKYILSRMTDFNFGVKAPRPRIKFRKLGNQNSEVINSLINSLMGAGRLGVDIQELGEIAGLTLTEIEETLKEPKVGNQGEDDAVGDEDAVDEDSSGDKSTKRTADGTAGGDKTKTGTVKKISARVRQQVGNYFQNPSSDVVITPGFERQLGIEFAHRGFEDPVTRAKNYVSDLASWANEYKTRADSVEDFMIGFETLSTVLLEV